MAERLVRVAKELNSGIASIIEFLASKGHLIDNKPTAIVSDEIISILRHEFKSYMHEKDKAGDFVIGRKNEFNEESKLETNEKTIREPIKTIQSATYKALGSQNEVKLASNEQKVVQAEIQESKIHIIDLYDNPEHELFSLLKRYWNTDSFRFIGRYKINKDGNTSTFENIRDQHGDLLYFPVIENSSINGGGVKAFSDRIFNLIEGEFYQFTAEINPIARNINKNPLYVKSQPFGHVKDNIKERLEKEALVKTIFKETIPNLTVSSNQANSIKKVTEDAYEEDDRFVFELIQNADDSGDDGKNLDCSFTFINNYLLVQHNGQVFTDDDVKAITGIGHSSTAKMSSLKKTGYKGIGFKAVFIVSDNVGIISGDYSFEFSKYHRFINEAGYGVDNTPWEILPIWFQRYRLPRFLYELVKFDKIYTNFVIEIKENQNINSDKVKKDALNIFSQPQFCLFLRHISKIHLKGLNEEKSIEKKYNKDTGFTELLIDKNQSSTWLKWVKEDIHITADVTKSLKDDSSIPDKLKKATSVSISFAAKIEDDRIVALNEKESVLFTYLPTTVRDYQFPFLVNADFLTILNRQSIKQGKEWNKFIFEKIAYSQFLWAIEIWNRKDQLSKYCLNIIKSAFNENEGMAFDGFNQGFYKALDEISFIPDVDGNLCNICDIIIDTTGLSKIIGIEKFYKVFSLNGSLLGEGIKNTSWLKLIIKQKFPSNYFDWDKCISNIISDGEWLQNPDINGEFLNHIIGKSKLPDFYNVTFVLDNFNKLSKPSEIIINAPNEKYEFLTRIGVKLLNKNIQIKHENPIEYGFNEFDGIALLNEYIIPNTEKINDIIKEKDINILFYRFLSEYYDKIPDEPVYRQKLLQNFCFFSHDGKFHSTISKSKVYLNESKSEAIKNCEAIPDDVFCLIDNKEYELAGDRYEEFWGKLDVEMIDANLSYFVKDSIISKADHIYNFYKNQLQEDRGDDHELLFKNVAFWQFLLPKLLQTSEFNDGKYTQELKKLPIICSSGNLKYIEECYILDSERLASFAELAKYGFEIDFISSLHLTHPEYDKEIIINWFYQCGVKKLDKNNLAQEIVNFSLSYEPTDFEENKRIVEILIDESKNERLSEDHYTQLKALKVKTINTDEIIYHPANKCHFSKEYLPTVCVESSLDPVPDHILLLSPDYISDRQNLNEVKEFFKKIKVTELFGYKSMNDTYTELEKSYDIDRILHCESFKERYNFLYARYTLGQIKSYTRLEKYLYFKWLDKNILQKYQNQFLNYLTKNISNENLFGKTKLINNGYAYYTDNDLIHFLKTNDCIKNQNGEFKKTSELYSIKLKDIIKDKNRLPADDLSKHVNNDSKTLEELIGIHQDLNHEICIEILTNPEKTIGITKIKDCDFFSKIDKKRIDEETIEKVHLINIENEWVLCKNLHILEDVQLGLGKYPSILHSWLTDESIIDMFKIKKLTRDDFNLDFGTIKDEGFKDRLIEKLKYIAFAEDQDHFEELMNNFVEAISPLEFLSSNKISSECTMVDPPIVQTEKQFEMEGTTIYYLRRWNGTFSSDLYKYIKYDLLKLNKVTQKELTDIIQFEKDEILDFFKEKNLVYPSEWENNNLDDQLSYPTISTIKINSDIISEPEGEIISIPPKINILKPNTYTEVEIAEIERLLSRSLDDSDMANQQILASYKALKYYEDHDYNIDKAKNEFATAIRKKYLSGIVEPLMLVSKRVIPRSAKTGVLKLNYNAWMDLADENTELFVVTGDAADDVIIFKDQKSLANFNEDPILTSLSETDKYSELSDMLSGEFLENKNKFRKLQLIIRVKTSQQNQSLFENFKDVDGSFDSDEKWD